MQTRAQPARRQLCLACWQARCLAGHRAQASPALTITLADGTTAQLDLAELQALPTQRPA
jgi:hypothetical protein